MIVYKCNCKMNKSGAYYTSNGHIVENPIMKDGFAYCPECGRLMRAWHKDKTAVHTAAKRNFKPSSKRSYLGE